MKKFIITVALLLPILVIGQSQDRNYVKSTSYQQPVDEGQEDNLDASQKIESISYVDGLGRPIQSIAVGAGGEGQNIISYVEYDGLGRTPKQYLPYATQTAVTNPLDFVDQEALKIAIEAFYATPKYEDTQNPYSEMVYENSPLNRIVKQGAPGNSWAVGQDDTDHTIKFEYANNQVNEVRYFDVTFSGGNTQNPSLVLSGYYLGRELYKSVTKDENWTPTSGNNHTTEEFTNKSGQVLLKRTYENNSAHDTYYVYDDYGNLTFVLSPEGSEKIVTGDVLSANALQILDDVCYQYKYDYRNRLIEKKIPAKGWEYIVYNLLDQPILTQDANQRSKSPKEWLFTKYDVFGRVAYTGIKRANIGRATFQSIVNNSDGEEQYEMMSSNPETIEGTQIYYTNTRTPSVFESGDQILTVNYYDTYTDLGGYNLPLSVYGQNITQNTQGLPTVSKVRVLGTDQWITTVTGYDDKARPIFGRSENMYLDTEDTSESLLDFTGKVLESRTTHQKAGHQEVVINDFFSYDHQNRLITQEQQIDNEPVQLIASNRYDELGQLASKRVGGQLFESGYTDITEGNINVSEDGIITKIAGGNSDYNAGLATVGKIEGDGGISFTNLVANKRYIIGLNDNNLYTSSVDEIDYAFYFFLNNPGRYKVRILEAGIHSYITEYINFDADDHFAIEREGNVLSFIHNGAIVATHIMTQNFPSLVGDVSIRDEGTQIGNLNLYTTNIDKSLQKVDYEYNIRGWLTDINPIGGTTKETDVFQFKINYDAPVEGDAGIAGRAVPLYNGNISQTTWKTTNADTKKRTYGYKYDALNRIKIAYSRKGIHLTDYDHFNVSGIDYDKNGNILTLTRQGENEDHNALAMDNLTYTYNGNQLLNVSDNGHVNLKNEGFYDGHTSVTLDDYEYDINGNLILDRNKGITGITYNHLNLPTIVKISTTNAHGNTQDGTITYIYDATGIKMAKVLQDDLQQATVSTFYAGGYIYENNDGNEVLKMFSHPEGYVEPVYGTINSVDKFNTQTQTTTFSEYQYAFNYTDHLGNVRLTYSDSDGDGTIKSNIPLYNENFNDIESIPSGTLHHNSHAVLTIINDRLEAEILRNFNYVYLDLFLEAGKTYRLTYTLDLDQAIGQFYNLIRRPSGAPSTWLYHSGSSIQSSDNYTVEFTPLESGIHKFYFGGLKRSGFPNGTDFPDPSTFYLDNILVVDTNQNSEIISEKHYYPFGLQQKGYNDVVTSNVNSVANRFGYNGIEQEQALGLNLYEMDVRQYDPAIARWTAIDPIIHYDFSAYSAFDNNPIFFADPSGADAVVTNGGDNMLFTGEDAIAAFNIIAGNNSESSDGCDNPDCKKKKKSQSKPVEEMSAGEFYGMAYNGEARTSFLNGNNPYNPTDSDIAQNEREMQEAAGEVFLFIAGEQGIKLIFQGGKWVYTAIRAKRITSVVRNSASAYAKANRIYRGQKHFSKQIADGYLEQMRAGTFDNLNGLSSLLDKSGRTIVTGGNHRINAAIRYGAETGNYGTLGNLMTAMRVTQGEAASYGYKILNIIK